MPSGAAAYAPATVRSVCARGAHGGGARTAIGRSELHVHDLRHFYATALLDQRAALHLIAPLLAHKSLQITERYAHVGKNYLANLRAKSARAIAPPSPKQAPPPAKCRIERAGGKRIDAVTG
jgi:integrase